MEKQETLNIHGYQIIANLKMGRQTSKRFTFNGGQIFMTVGPLTSKRKLEKLIEQVMPESKIKKFNSEPYVGKDYIWITGTKHRLVVLEEGSQREKMDDYVIKRRVNIRPELRKLAYDIYLNEIRKIEKEMGIRKPHSLKVTKMTAAVGKHYQQKNMITLDETLIHYSLPIIDSVVAHELCHYYYQNHSKEFYDLLLKYCPDYKALKNKLTYGVKK
jgi:predicted metal-dependent hydrolase